MHAPGMYPRDADTWTRTGTVWSEDCHIGHRPHTRLPRAKICARGTIEPRSARYRLTAHHRP
eukprot:5965746-Prymnesium_polylepis.1